MRPPHPREFRSSYKDTLDIRLVAWHTCLHCLSLSICQPSSRATGRLRDVEQQIHENSGACVRKVSQTFLSLFRAGKSDVVRQSGTNNPPPLPGHARQPINREWVPPPITGIVRFRIILRLLYGNDRRTFSFMKFAEQIIRCNVIMIVIVDCLSPCN